jgi:hypothetical protein
MPNPPAANPSDPAGASNSLLMKFRGAYLEERGVHFAVISVEQDAVQTESARKEASRTYQRFFPDASIVLMTESEGQPPVYYGRRDIVAFLNTLEDAQIKWKTYTVQLTQQESSPSQNT